MVIANDHYQSIGIVCLSVIRGVRRVARKRSISFNLCFCALCMLNCIYTVKRKTNRVHIDYWAALLLGLLGRDTRLYIGIALNIMATGVRKPTWIPIAILWSRNMLSKASGAWKNGLVFALYAAFNGSHVTLSQHLLCFLSSIVAQKSPSILAKKLWLFPRNRIPQDCVSWFKRPVLVMIDRCLWQTQFRIDLSLHCENIRISTDILWQLLSFSYFNGTGSVYACVRKSTE